MRAPGLATSMAEPGERVETTERPGAARSGFTWHFARPPIVEIEYEMDCRAVQREQVV